jgi:hypothetical protein
MEQTDIMRLVQELHDIKGYQELTWEGNFEDYLALVQKNPDVARTAFQRIYDMILSHGSEEYTEHKKKIIRYHFFRDPFENGKDAVFGLDIPLMKLVNMFKAAAKGYGPEKRVLILHGPVGSAKSTIARLLKKGLEAYSKIADGGALHLRLETQRAGERPHLRQRGGDSLPDARRTDAPDSLRNEGAHPANDQRPSLGGPPHPRGGRSVPAVPLHVPRVDDVLSGRLAPGHEAPPRQTPRALRKGPRGHRHLPAER